MADSGDMPASKGAETASVADGTCMACKKSPIEYACVPCGHATLCKACGMKMATGGKCKQCGKLFGQLKRTHAQPGTP